MPIRGRCVGVDRRVAVNAVAKARKQRFLRPVGYRPGATRPLRSTIPNTMVLASFLYALRPTPYEREAVCSPTSRRCRSRRVLKERSELGRKLPLALVAVPPTMFGHVGDRRRAATRPGASDAIRPANLDEEIVRHLRVGELPSRFEHRLGNRLLVHT